MCDTSRDIIRYFSTVASEDPVVIQHKCSYLFIDVIALASIDKINWRVANTLQWNREHIFGNLKDIEYVRMRQQMIVLIE